MNKPVAWIEEDGMVRFDIAWASQMQGKEPIPLYTHPVKELTLTKEEIHAVWASGQYYTLDKDGSIDEFHFADFARAILKKARE